MSNNQNKTNTSSAMTGNILRAATIDMSKFVDIKIRAKYRDMLKEYCKDNGYKILVF